MDAVIHENLRDEKREMGRRIICSRIGRYWKETSEHSEQAVLTEDEDFKLKLKTLCIFVDKDNLLRVKTRIAQRDDRIFDIQWFYTRTIGGDCEKVG